MPEGSVATGTLRLVNPTDATVRIARIDTSCGCTSATKVASVAPHATADLRVGVATEGKRGSFSEFVTVRFSDEARSPLVIPLDVSRVGQTTTLNRLEGPSEACKAP